MKRTTKTFLSTALLLGVAFTSLSPVAYAAHNDDNDGLEALTRPVVMGVANPLTTDVGRGVAGTTKGTQHNVDLLGDAIATLMHTLDGIAANTEQGTGVAVANTAPAVQDTVQAIHHNNGALGDVAKIVGG